MADSQSEDEYIGTARMEMDGTINMRLRAAGRGVIGIGTITYPKDHPNYAEILQHLGPMNPGDQVKVRPWPD